MELNGQLSAKSSREAAYTRTHVDSELAKVGVELTGETQASRDSGHDDRDEVVEIAVCRCRELERAEADIVERLVIDAECLVRVLNELVDRERRVVWLKNAVKQIDDDVTTCAPTSTTVSDTLGLGTTEYVAIIRSGYSSRIFEMRRVPIPAPVPPPSEWVIWKPERQP